MDRSKFISGDNVGKHLDDKSGMTLYPYRDRVIKANTIWKSRNPPAGMLMIRSAVQRYNRESAEFDGEHSWEVAWRSNDGKEHMEWNLTASDILREFDPVFSVV